MDEVQRKLPLIMSTITLVKLLNIVALVSVAGCQSGSRVDTEPTYVFQGSESEVKTFASTYAHALMRHFNPQTGHDPYYRVNTWNYDPSTAMYAIDMTAIWSGKPNMFADECVSELSLVYRVARDGSSFSVDRPTTNGCVDVGQFSDGTWDLFVQEMIK